MKKLIKRVLCVLLAVLLPVAGYIAYVFIDYHRIDDKQALEISSVGSCSDKQVQTGTSYRIVSANIGFGAYSADYSFFKDGGKESRARSEEAVLANVSGSTEIIAAQQPDFIFVQEVDFDSTRSHHVDERAIVIDGLAAESDADGYSINFAQNYDSPYLFYPFLSPHGASKSGILTFSVFPIHSALRRSLPIETGVMKLVDLDRCYSVSRIAAENGRELVLYNLHLSAYTSDGTIATEQLQMLCDDMKAEAEKGNYCIAGGDFNKDLLGSSGDIFGVAASENDTWAQPIPEGTIPDGLSLVVPFDEAHPLASCRTASEPYNVETTFRITVDGFLVSSDVEVIASDVVDAGYAYSDHNPVYMDFILK